MYNLADSMVELKHNAQTSKQEWFSFVLVELPLFVFYFMIYNAQPHES